MDIKLKEVSTAALAYLGDSVMELCVRKMLVERGFSSSKRLNAKALEYVTAKAQAQMFERIEPMLLDDEREMFRRASNSTHLNKPKNASGKDYRVATGFEAVIGMLEWIGDTQRLEELLRTAHGGEENDKEN